MCPTPPVGTAATADCNGTCTTTYSHNFNHGGENREVKESVVMNGLPGEVQMEGEPEKARRGRPPKGAVKQQPPNGAVKKRGRPPKVKSEDVPTKQSKITDTMKKAKRTVNRFKDVTKEELLERFLPDRIKPDLDILIIGINPGLFAAYKGHHYAGPGNHFWKCLFLSGLIPIPLTGMEDYQALDYGIGFTNIVERTTPGSKDLSSKEIREGAKKLVEKIQLYKPKIAVFNGKGIYEIFSKEIFAQKKKDFVFGTQVNKIPGTDTAIFVMASSSARCAQFPRAQDKVHFYVKLKQLRDTIRGIRSDDPICEVGYSFDLKKATELAKVQNIKQEKIDPDYDAFDSTKNPAGTSGLFPTSVTMSSVANVATNTLTTNKTSGLQSDSNNNILSEEKHPIPQTSGTQTPNMTNNNNNVKLSIMPQDCAPPKDEGTVTARHAHLVRYLRQDAPGGPQEAGPSHGRKAGLPLTLSPTNPKLQQDVSEEMRQERVGNWVREQQNLEYDSDPPMGMDPPDEGTAGQDGNSAAGVEIDRASQQSAVSAGVSGSASESTSGYGSIDASSRRVRLDRVEMWVLEQQHVRRHSPNQQLQQSIQAASANNHAQATPVSRMETNQPVAQFHPSTVGWLQSAAITAGYPVTFGNVYTQASSGVATVAMPGQIFMNGGARNHKIVTQANHVTTVADSGAGPSALPTQSMSAGRSSPFGFVRNGTPSRREGGSGSSFGTVVRPPVPLYSSWGGEESGSAGSGISSPAAPFLSNQPSQPTPAQSFNSNSNNNNNAAAQSAISQHALSPFNLAWQPLGRSPVLSPYFNSM